MASNPPTWPAFKSHGILSFCPSETQIARRNSSGRSGTVLTLLLALASAASAQTEPGSSPPGPFPAPQPTYPVEMGLTLHHSSTAAEGAARGRAAVIQAEGNYRLSESQAGILDQQERWYRAHNNVEQTRHLYAQKKLWEAHRDEARQRQEQNSAKGREKLADRRATIYLAAYRLTPDQFDATTGDIAWPELLKAPKFNKHREQLEELFRQQFAYGDPQPGNSVQIERCVNNWKRTLAKEIQNLPRDEYLAAQKFLVGLKFAAEFPGQFS